MKNDGEFGKNFADLLENVKAKLGLLTGLKFISAVACADCYCKRVNARSCNEIVNLLGLCVGCVLIGNINVILNTCKLTKLALNNNAVSVSIVNNLFGYFNIFFIGEMRAVNHNGSKAAVNASLAGLKIGAVVKVQSNGKTRCFNSSLNKLNEISVVSISSCAL